VALQLSVSGAVHVFRPKNEENRIAGQPLPATVTIPGDAGKTEDIPLILVSKPIAPERWYRVCDTCAVGTKTGPGKALRCQSAETAGVQLKAAMVAGIAMSRRYQLKWVEPTIKQPQPSVFGSPTEPHPYKNPDPPQKRDEPESLRDDVEGIQDKVNANHIFRNLAWEREAADSKAMERALEDEIPKQPTTTPQQPTTTPQQPTTTPAQPTTTPAQATPTPTQPVTA